MTTQQVASLGGRFAQFLAGFPCCFGRPTFEHFLTYCRGLLGPLPRKCVERIALAPGAAVRTLREFLTHLDWDQDRMRDLIQQRIEHLFRVAKNEVGLDHFEGRSYIGLIHHQTLCLLMVLLLAEQTTRLRRENPQATMEQTADHTPGSDARSGRPGYMRTYGNTWSAS